MRTHILFNRAPSLRSSNTGELNRAKGIFRILPSRGRLKLNLEYALQENTCTVHVGSGTVCSFWLPLKVLQHILRR